MNHGSFVLGLALFAIALVIGAIIWASLRPDPVGRRLVRTREAVGLQGRQAQWLETRAPLDRPKPTDLTSDHAGLLTRPAQRVYQAVVQREALVTQRPMEEALAQLRARAPTPRSKRFLEGDVRGAVRAHARSLYRGPESLFLVWFYLVALVRWGRRHLYLDMIAAVVEDLR